MKVSLNWIRFYNDIYKWSADPAPLGIDDLVNKIGTQLGAVEEVIDLGKRYHGIIVVKVISCTGHPNADKLTVCLVDDGGKFKKVKRNKSGLIEIVCGAPNVKAGMLAAWIPPGKTVPSTFDKEPLVLEAREIRGIVSSGMLASAKELELGDDHDGILEVDENAKPGVDFAKLYGLDDYIIDIENKMFTHRPDCFGMLGIAREIAGIQGHAFQSPQWYRQDITINKSRARDDHKLAVKNNTPKLVPRFSAVVIKDVIVKPSPVWLRSYLARVGVKPINTVVDFANYHMYLTAQPLHAYDYDKVLAVQKDKKSGVKMGVRLSKKGEQLKLLGGKQLKLDEGTIVITADDSLIGLGGVMGGADAEVDENTKNIILESANFDMNTIRKTAMRYGLFTDAATRFTKGQSPLQTMAVLAKATDDILRIAGGRVSALIDEKSAANFERVAVRTSSSFINSRLGLSLPSPKIHKLLGNVEFGVSPATDGLLVSVPFWRSDIEIPEDIVEEVGRLYGYEHLPQVLPPRDLEPPRANATLEFKAKVRDLLAAAGANEVLTYSFVHAKLLERAGQDKAAAYKIANALSPDLQYYRLSVTPNLLEKIHPNIKAGYDVFSLFEIGKAHQKGELNKEKLPVEFERLSLIFASKDSNPRSGAAFYLVKFYADYLMDRLGISNIIIKPASRAKLSSAWKQTARAFDIDRTAAAYDGNLLLGLIGEPAGSLRTSLKLPTYTAQLELSLENLLQASSTKGAYLPLNRFPSLEQDLCLKLSAKINYASATGLIYGFLDKSSLKHGYSGRLHPIDIYQNQGDKNHKQVTWRIILSHPERTLTTQEANKLLDEIGLMAKKEIGAERI